MYGSVGVEDLVGGVLGSMLRGNAETSTEGVEPSSHEGDEKVLRGSWWWIWAMLTARFQLVSASETVQTCRKRISKSKVRGV